MSRIRIYARNLTANWVGYLCAVGVMFFLSPFIVHRLGIAAYGVWSLLISVTGFLGLAELGVRGGLGRFMNYYMGKKDLAKVNAIINTSFAFFFFSGLILFPLVAGMSLAFGKVFPKIPPEILVGAKIAIVIVGIHIWVSFFLASFNQILAACDRFDLQNVVKIAAIIIQAAGTIFVLTTGGGIVRLAAVHIIATGTGVFFAYILTKKIFPEFSLNTQYVSMDCFREMFGFSMWAFVGKIALKFLYWIDVVLIGMLIGPDHVTYYAIAATLVMHARGIVMQCSFVLTPQIVKDCAKKDWPALHNLFQRGSTMVMAVGIPILIGFIVFGKEFIILWMGPEYETGYAILFILALAQIPAIAASLTGPIFSGLNKIHLDSGFTVIQCVVNFTLSLIFVMQFGMGIQGIAWATLVPRVLMSVIAIILAIRMINLPVKRFLKNILSRWIILTASFFAICLILNRMPGHGQWIYFFTKVLLAVMIYIPLIWVGILTKRERSYTISLVNKRAA